MTENTRDLAKFGYRELEVARDLLTRLLENDVEDMGDGVAIEFNPSSGHVFLVDDDYRTYMLNDSGKLEEWFYCSEEGHEGFKEDLVKDCIGCKEILGKDIEGETPSTPDTEGDN